MAKNRFGHLPLPENGCSQTILRFEKRRVNPGEHRAEDGDPGTMANLPHLPKRFVAYFSMEIALENAMPTYSG